jgi:FtsH-binding integral membrane protein
MKGLIKCSLPIRLLAIVLLAFAFFKQPYWYYQCVHWVICGSAIASAVFAHREKQNAFTWIFIAVAILFNPFFPFYFHREIWQVIDVLAAIVFAASLALFRRPTL